MLKKLGFALGASVGALAMAPAANAAIFIGISFDGGATITQVADDSGLAGSANYVAANNGGYFFNVGATGVPLTSLGTLLTQSLNIQNEGGANGLVEVFITQTDISLASTGVFSAFTSNTINGATATLTSYYDDANGVFTMPNQLHQAVFTGLGINNAANPIAVSGTWSETVRYSVNFTGGSGSNFNGTANLTAVPEPTTWALLILGFGAVGHTMRRRSSQVRVAKASLKFA